MILIKRLALLVMGVSLVLNPLMASNIEVKTEKMGLYIAEALVAGINRENLRKLKVLTAEADKRYREFDHSSRWVRQHANTSSIITDDEVTTLLDDMDENKDLFSEAINPEPTEEECSDVIIHINNPNEDDDVSTLTDEELVKRITLQEPPNIYDENMLDHIALYQGNACKNYCSSDQNNTNRGIQCLVGCCVLTAFTLLNVIVYTCADDFIDGGIARGIFSAVTGFGWIGLGINRYLDLQWFKKEVASKKQEFTAGLEARPLQNWDDMELSVDTQEDTAHDWVIPSLEVAKEYIRGINQPLGKKFARDNLGSISTQLKVIALHAYDFTQQKQQALLKLRFIASKFAFSPQGIEEN